MKNFLSIAIPLTALAAGTAYVITHKKECKKYVKAAKYWGTDNLEKVYDATANCVEKLFICPEKYRK